ncbi:hypothetical protein ACW4FQ_33025, partial [Escherichia coli]
VFMVLGQSAATAACQAIDEGVAVQDVNYTKLRDRLLKEKQVLEWIGPRKAAATGIDSKSLPGIVVDNSESAKATIR